MAEALPESFSGLTTLRVGGPPAELIRAGTEAEVVRAVDEADRGGQEVLVLGGGSNLLVADDGFPGRAVRVQTRGIELESEDACGGATVAVAAGEPWDDLVALSLDRGWRGLEALSGIPGQVGATPIQNVGAYGSEVSRVIATVRCWDRQAHERRTFAAAECGFGYRTSRFKQEPGRYVVLSVTFQLPLGESSAPVEYAELARMLDRDLGESAAAVDVRRAVLALRRSKGMVLDEDDHDTWSAGSFFTNPVLAARDVPPEAPAWPQPDGRVKTSAAWLIERAGFTKGFGRGPAALSTKHTLALTNRGGATAADLVALAREIRDGVRDAFGIELVNEPVLVGCRL